MSNPQSNLLSAMSALWRKLPGRRRIQLGTLLAMSVAASAFEVLTLGLLFPFLALLATPIQDSRPPVIERLMEIVGTQSVTILTQVVLVAFCLAVILSGLVRLAVLVATNKFSHALATDLGQEIYRRTLYQPYPVHLSQNSSSILDAALNKTMAVSGNIVGQAMSLLTAVMIGVGIFATIIVVDPIIAGATGIVFGTIYVLIFGLAKGQLRSNAQTVAEKSVEAVKALQEGLGGIRDVIIDGNQDAYVQVFREADRPFKMALAKNVVLAGAPRFVVETLGMVLIALVAFFVSGDAGIGGAIPTLGVIALGAQRLLPIFQQSYSSIAIIRGNGAALFEVLRLLDRPVPAAERPDATPVSFKREIRLTNVRFAYPGSSTEVLHGIDLLIEKGSRVGLFGPTGGGKSTVLDIIMGLLAPTSGRLAVDGKSIDLSNHASWRRHVAHVPQTIFLSDGTVAENIAFGAGNIDLERVREAAHRAQIGATVEAWPSAYDTLVGERGVRLSGGQRQRIGVARALYKQADLIILDEATSALDNETEASMITSIEALGRDVTVLMVAHRLTTLRNCDVLVELEQGKVKRTGTYTDLIGR